MPAGQPAQALDRRFLLSDMTLLNVGADTTVNWTRGAFNRATGAIVLGGDNSYVGLMANGIFDDVVQGAVIPPTGATPISDICVNKITGEWLVLIADRLFRMAADLSSQVEITSPAVVSRESVIEWRGRIYVGKFFNGPPGAGDIEFSDDNGVTWDTVPGIVTGMNVDVDGLYSDPNETVLLGIPRGGTDAAFTRTTGAASATWTLIPLGNAGLPVNDAAISDDGIKAVIIDSNASITVTDDAFNSFTLLSFAQNLFKGSAGAGLPQQAVEYVADLGGFVIVSESLSGIMGFIPEDEMTQVIMGSYFGVGPTVLPDRCGVTDGEQVMFAGFSNKVIISLRKIGQTGQV